MMPWAHCVLKGLYTCGLAVTCYAGPTLWVLHATAARVQTCPRGLRSGIQDGMGTRPEGRDGGDLGFEGRKHYICASRLGLIRWYIIQMAFPAYQLEGNPCWRNTIDIHLPHHLLHCASPIGKQYSILVPQHLAEQGTQKSGGIRPHQRAGHIAVTSAGHGRWLERRPRKQSAGCTHVGAQQELSRLCMQRAHSRGPTRDNISQNPNTCSARSGTRPWPCTCSWCPTAPLPVGSLNDPAQEGAHDNVHYLDNLHTVTGPHNARNRTMMATIAYPG